VALNRIAVGTKPAVARIILDQKSHPDADYGDEHEPHLVRRFVLLVLVLLVIAGAVFGAYRWSRTQYYVGAQGSNVAIFRGLTQDVGPVRTSTLYRQEQIALRDLPTYQQEQVRADIATDGLPDAEKLVAQLKEQADACRALATAAPPPSPSPSPSPSTTPSPTGSAAGPASPSPTPTPATSTTISDGTVIDANDCGTQP